MKTGWLLNGICGLALVAANRAEAQGFGLPVVDSADLREEGYVNSTVGANLGKDVQFYGARVTTTAQKWLRLFMDVGAVRPEKGDTDLGAQGGVLASLNVQSPVDLAVRITLYGMPGDKMDVIGGTAMVLVSAETIFEGLFFYSGLGVDVSRTKTHGVTRLETTEVTRIVTPADTTDEDGGTPEETTETSSRIVKPADTTDERVRPLWAGGVVMPITKNIAFFSEITYTDTPFIGLGFCFQ